MYRVSEFKQESYKTGEVADILNVTTKTVMNYDKQGLLVVKRTPMNRRLVLREDLLAYLDKAGLLYDDTLTASEGQKVDVIYSRVYDVNNADFLDKQTLYILEHVNNLSNPLVIKEIGGGYLLGRKKIVELTNLVLGNKVKNIYVVDESRLASLNIQYLKLLFNRFGVQVHTVECNDTDYVNKIEKDLSLETASIIHNLSK